jgi:hypothetical protein
VRLHIHAGAAPRVVKAQRQFDDDSPNSLASRVVTAVTKPPVEKQGIPMRSAEHAVPRALADQRHRGSAVLGGGLGSSW